MNVLGYNLPMRDKTPLILIVVLIGLAVLLVIDGGITKLFDGLITSANTFLRTTPLLIAAFLVAGFTQVLVNEEFVTRWLGKESGWKGIGLACLAGALIPGGPYVYYPIAAVLMKSGAGIGVLVAFVSAKNLWSVTRLPYEVALIGMEVTVSRFLLTLIFPPLLGWAAELLFGRVMDKIRSEASV